MAFAYYRRLTRAGQRVYRLSDEIGSIALPAARGLAPAVAELERALASGNRPLTRLASRRFISLVARMLKVASVQVEVMAVRPSRTWGELHGLYTPANGRVPATITVWMRTAQRRQVVAFRTFLRTLLHEMCHHLDYELYRLPESYHTEGFYKRESSLMHQVMVRTGQHEASAHGGSIP